MPPADDGDGLGALIAKYELVLSGKAPQTLCQLRQSSR